MMWWVTVCCLVLFNSCGLFTVSGFVCDWFYCVLLYGVTVVVVYYSLCLLCLVAFDGGLGYAVFLLVFW